MNTNIQRYSLLLILIMFFALNAENTSRFEEQKKLLSSNNIEATEDGIIKYLTEISPKQADLDNIEELINQLGASSFKTRQSAQKKLIALGKLVQKNIEQALLNKDPEISSRAKEIFDKIRGQSANLLLNNCYEILKAMNSKKAISAIIYSAPLQSTPYLQRSANDALDVLVEGKDLDILEKALKNPNLAIRLAAIAPYAKLLGKDKVDVLDSYLTADKDEIRFAAAKALANLGVRKAIPTLIQLLDSEELDIRISSNLYLRQLTNQKFLFEAYADKTKRAAAINAWEEWFKVNGATAKLNFPVKEKALQSYLNGHTLIAMGNGSKGVNELDGNGKLVWEYSFSDCWSAEKLSNGNYLIGSHSTNKLIEVTPEKKIVWEYETTTMGAVELENGNILVATYLGNSVIEIRKSDKQIVWQYNAGDNCFKVVRLPNGNTLVSGLKFIREVNPNKEVVWEYNQGQYFYSVQALENGNIVVSEYTKGVFEINRQKEIVWSYDIKTNVTGAYKLENGHYLMSIDTGVIEVNAQKETIWTYDGSQYGSAKK